MLKENIRTRGVVTAMKLWDACMRISRYLEAYPLGGTAKIKWTFRKLELTSRRTSRRRSESVLWGTLLGLRCMCSEDG
jgi:hypothetical protein